jgi:hypothetical protein
VRSAMNIIGHRQPLAVEGNADPLESVPRR